MFLVSLEILWLEISENSDQNQMESAAVKHSNNSLILMQ